MVPSCFMFVFCYISAHPLNLHSFPTRRSSDLRMRSREGRLGKWSLLDEEILRPIVDEDGSDSAMLDNVAELLTRDGDRKSTRLNSSHLGISYAVFCLKKKRRTLKEFTYQNFIN